VKEGEYEENIYNVKVKKESLIKESEAIPISNTDSKENLTDTKKETEKKEEEENKKKKDEEKKQLYEYESDELNELKFEDAIEYDKRSFCRYYINILFYSHIILSVFFRFGDFNLFTVKLGLFFMTFPINLTMNIFFFTNESITLDYLKSADNFSSFWRHIDNTLYSSLLSSFLLILLKLLCLTHNSVRQLRKIRDVNEAQQKSNCILLCVKIRIAIYYVLSFAFLIIFGFYVLCFCAVFENTQITLIKSTFTSWLISLLYPFIICLITSLVRKASFSCNSKFLYGVKKIMQFL
jgi:nitrate reductase NapE component